MSLLIDNPLMNRFWREGIELQARWFNLFDKIGIKYNYASEESGKTQLNYQFLQLFYRYSEKGRYYHTPKHVLDCLNELEDAQELAEAPEAVSLALWFHDVVYNPQSKDNEEKSKQYSEGVLQKIKLPEGLIQKTNNLILFTQHLNEPVTIDEKLIVDIDLSILGKNKEDFNEYEKNIRKEYAWVCQEEFKVGRKKVLELFLNRNSIYKTNFFKEKYEKQARINLEKSISCLNE